MNPARMLITLGALFIAAGVLWIVGEKLGLGRLPGDLLWKRKNVTVYFPLVTSLVVSVVLTLLLNLFRK